MEWHERYDEAAGIVPMFLSEHDERDAVAQINTSYAHGGGWYEFPGFELSFDADNPKGATLRYPGDPVYQIVAYTKLRDEWVLLFQHAWCVVVRDGSDEFRCSRLD